MGCTSSAPSVVEVHANSTEGESKNEQNEDEELKMDKNYDSFKNGDEFLKSSTGNNIQVNENTSVIITDFDNDETGQNIVGHEAICLILIIVVLILFKSIAKYKNVNDADDTHQNENKLADKNEKISSLEEVIEHVITTKVLQKQPSLEELDSKSEHNEMMERDNDNHVETNKDTEETIETKEELAEDEVQESASPSQSECSRATRWEALADMAAELPPSLTIDPITGHIYALSK